MWLKAKANFISLWLKCERSLEVLLGNLSLVRAEKNSVWCSYTNSGAVLLHLITGEGPAASLHGAVIFKQGEVCPSAGTLSPQSR